MAAPSSRGDVELAACGLAPSVLATLLKAGFRYKADVAGLTARELSNEAGISAADAARVVELACPPAKGQRLQPITALDLLQEQERLLPISTLVPELDHILGGGFARGEVTELCGAPGSGKTQIGLHMCVAAQCQFAANSATRFAVVFIDTEGGFVVDRIAAIAETTVEHRPDLKSRGVDRDELLRGIVYYRAHDFVEQMEVMNALPELLHRRPEIQMLIVDSVAFHFRHGFEEFSQRIRALDTIASLMHRLVVDFNLSVLLINQVTARSGNTNRSGAVDVPTLGESWSHAITNRLSLSWEGDERVAIVAKSSLLAHERANFRVTSNGVESPN